MNLLIALAFFVGFFLLFGWGLHYALAGALVLWVCSEM